MNLLWLEKAAAETAEIQQLLPKGPGSCGDIMGRAERPAPAGASLETPRPSGTVCDAAPGYHGTEKPDRRQERTTETLLWPRLRAASAHGKRRHNHGNLAQAHADVRPALPAGPGCQNSPFLEMALEEI